MYSNRDIALNEVAFTSLINACPQNLGCQQSLYGSLSTASIHFLLLKTCVAFPKMDGALACSTNTWINRGMFFLGER